MVSTKANNVLLQNSNDSRITSLKTVLIKALVAKSKWPDKDEFLDVIYWFRQIFGVLLGIIWGIVPFTGFVGVLLFTGINCMAVYIYAINFQNIDEDSYGGSWELIKEGFMTSFSCFLVTWIIFYTGLYHNDVPKGKIIN